MEKIFIISAIPLVISFVLIMIMAQRMKIISYNGYATLRSKGGMSRGMEIGGLSLFPIMLISMCSTLALPYMFHLSEIGRQIAPAIMRVLQVLVGCSFLYLIGVKDDFHGTGTKTKVIVVLFTAAMFPFTGLWIDDLYGLFGIHRVPVWVGVPISWLIAAFLIQLPTIIDSPDGITSGTSTFVMLLFLILSIYCNHVLSAIIGSAAVGVALPYAVCKRFSKKWLKTLMGSSGNYIMGYILSYLALGMFRQCGHRLPEEAVMVCIGIVFVPVVDAIRVLVNRIVEGRDIFTPDKNQMQHLLIRVGMNKRVASVVTMLVILFFVSINLLCLYNEVSLTVIFVIDVAALVLFSILVKRLIIHRETVYTHEKWNKVYGREAWEANVPSEILQRKIENFGTMGLPPEMLLTNTEEFIPDGMSRFGRGMKRLVDFIASALCLVVFSPLFLLCYIMIKLDDGGPAIYKQERIGHFGRSFYIYKFRSMRTDAEKIGPSLSHAGGEDDPRLTKVGKFMRAHHLDELPQLWNVFIGDMSFIGYRPERKFYIDQIMEYDPRYAFLYQIRPGVTSYATLHYGYTDTLEKMLRRTELDLHYLKNRSWWFDIKILFLTFTNIIFGKKF